MANYFCNTIDRGYKESRIVFELGLYIEKLLQRLFPCKGCYSISIFTIFDTKCVKIEKKKLWNCHKNSLTGVSKFESV